MKKTFGILAYPAGHSFSPVMHGAGFRELDLPYEFEAWDVKPEELRGFMEALKPSIEGFSVSMPHKEAIIPFLDEIDDAAHAVGAVSCVYMRDGKYIGTNLDYIGVKGSLEASNYAKTEKENGVKRPFQGKKAIVLGAGGAAKAAIYGLLQMGIEPILFNRTLEKAKKVADQFGIEAHFLEELEANYSDAKIIINCTCLGLENDVKIVPDSVFSHIKLSLDAVYAHEFTIFQKQAMAAGAESFTGLEWLLHQGYEAFRLWTEQEAPKKAMRDEVRSNYVRN